MLKQYKYFAIRVGQMVVIRRVLNTLKVVQSRLYKPGSDFALTQISYTGGKVIGAIKLNDYQLRCSTGNGLGAKSVVKLSRETVRALKPFMVKGE